MRVRVSALLTTAILLAGHGCSDSGDPIADKCASACEVNESLPPACAAIEQQCVADCKKLSSDAERNEAFIAGCGECVAESFKYAYKTDPPCDQDPADPSCWCDTQHLTPGDPECMVRCYEPDGGVGY